MPILTVQEAFNCVQELNTFLVKTGDSELTDFMVNVDKNALNTERKTN